MKHVGNETYTFGIILTVICFSMFIFLGIKLAMSLDISILWGILIGPIVAISAARPGPQDGPWLWEKRIYEDD